MYVPNSNSWEFSGRFMCPVAVVKSSVSKSSNALMASHNRTVLSIEPKGSQRKPLVCSCHIRSLTILCVHRVLFYKDKPLPQRHYLPDAKISPSLLNLSEHTVSVWPFNSPTIKPCPISQRSTLPSVAPVARNLPLGENVKE